MDSELIIAFFGFVGVLATAGVGMFKVNVERMRVNVEKDKLRQAEREISFQRAALGFPEFVSEWGEIGDELERLMCETEIDRFLILRAWNGFLEPRWTTAVYQLRQGKQAPISYIHFELDEDYVIRIRKIVKDGPIVFDTANIPSGEIKRVYEAEGVTASLWAHLDSFETSDKSSKALAYCSFSTHSGELSPTTVTRCKIIIGRLKWLAKSFDHNEYRRHLNGSA